jgi:hypothetical protein
MATGNLLSKRVVTPEELKSEHELKVFNQALGRLVPVG